MAMSESGDQGFSPWARVAEYRCQFADAVETLGLQDLDAPSWCRGWRVRDVLAHLVHLAEASQVSMARDMVRNGMRPDTALARIARRLGDQPVPLLVERLRQSQGGRFHVVGFPPAVALGDVLVHGNDALRGVGLEFEVRPADVLPVLNTYRRVGGLAFHGRPHRNVRLVGTDIDWSLGNGPEVHGRVIDLLMLTANRVQVIPSLSGPGVSGIAT
jgi:uncharacterized protein (TIGR03083 family)